MSPAPFHLDVDVLLRLREGRLDTARQLRVALHLVRCPECIRLAMALWPMDDSPLAEEPVAQAIRRLAEPAAWPVLGAAHVETLDRIETAPGAFVELLVEEAVVLALERGSVEAFSLPMVVAEIGLDFLPIDMREKILRRVLIRRGYAAAVLGVIEVAKTSLDHASEVAAGVEDAVLDAEYLAASGRLLDALGGDAASRYFSARHYAKGAKQWLREIELHLATFGPEAQTEAERARAIETLEEARAIRRKIPRADILRQRTASILLCSFAADLAVSCSRNGLDVPPEAASYLAELDAAGWTEDGGSRAIGQQALNRGRLLLALGEQESSEEAFLEAIEASVRVGENARLTMAFHGLVRHLRATGKNVSGPELGGLFKRIEERLGSALFHRFLGGLTTVERAGAMVKRSAERKLELAS